MNRSTFALFVAILVHMLIFLLLWIFLSTASLNTNKQLKKQERKIKISLKELPLKDKKSGLTKKKIPQPKIAPPMPKGSQLKKFVIPKKAVKKQKPKKTKKPKTKQKQKTKPLLSAKKEYNSTKPTTQKKKAMAWLYEDVTDKEKREEREKKVSDNSSISQDIKELYGEKFGKLTPGQQKYILDNQEIMRRITQQVLNRVASVNIPRDLRVNKSNIIEFKLHPNGDMTDFKFLSKSGYFILDETTKETIEYAYSRYPRPTETTLIRYNVYYRLAY